jgi:DNA replication and repair protein RecF
LKLKNVQLENFRNHSSTMINCSQGVNVFLGNNGEGKTNILEGMSFLCLSKSIFNASDSIVTKNGEKYFTVSGGILSDGGVEYEARVGYEKEQNFKTVTINKARLEKLSLLIGQFPIVVLSPEQSSITLGSPIDRRRFVDFVISQSSKTYLENLIDYRKILKQRNKILTDLVSNRKENGNEIESWNENLVKVGSAIMQKRMEFVELFKGIMVKSYSQLAGKDEQPGISYEPSFQVISKEIEGIKSLFLKAIDEQWTLERRIGYSLVGPHKDEFVFQINSLNARSYASQGQHKTLLIALKLAEFYYLKEQCKETPVLLLDDVLSELDRDRSQRLLEVVADLGQIFITSADERTLDWLPVASALPRKFYIKQGKIERVEDAIFKN